MAGYGRDGSEGNGDDCCRDDDTTTTTTTTTTKTLRLAMGWKKKIARETGRDMEIVVVVLGLC